MRIARSSRCSIRSAWACRSRSRRSYCVQWAINALEWYGEAIDKLYDEVAPTDRSVLALITREPVGVVGAVLPWNWPMGLLGWKVPPALAAGNSVVLKPDEQTSLSALRFAALAQEAGLPEGVLNVVTGGPAVGEAIGRHPDIDVVGFTGSTEVGQALHEVLGRIEHEADLDRVRRQGPEHRLRGRPRSRCRRPDGGIHDLPEHRPGVRGGEPR